MNRVSTVDDEALLMQRARSLSTLAKASGDDGRRTRATHIAQRRSLKDLPDDDDVLHRRAAGMNARKDSDLHQWSLFVVNSKTFNGLVMIVIITNAIVIAIETDRSFALDNQLFFQCIDVIFLCVYSVEFMLKIYADGVRGYFRSSYNNFDAFVLLLSYLELVAQTIQSFGDFGFLRVLRALRALRALRSISFVRSLQVIVVALLKTAAGVFYIVFLLLLLIYIFAVVGYYTFGFDETGDRENWGTLDRAMMSLFVFVTVDGWFSLQDNLDETNGRNSRFFTVVYIFIAHFIVQNLFVGVIVQNLEEAQDEERHLQRNARLKVISKKKAFILERQRNDFQALLERQKVQPSANLQEILAEMTGKLRHDDLVPMINMSCNLTWLETYISVLQHQEGAMHRGQQLSFELASVLANLVEKRLQGRVHAE